MVSAPRSPRDCPVTAPAACWSSPATATSSWHPDRFLVRPGDRDDVRRLVDTVVGTHGSAGIVHLWSLDAKVGPDATAGDLEAAHRLGCGSILPLVQELAAARRPGRLPLWLVTRGAQPAGGVAGGRRADGGDRLGDGPHARGRARRTSGAASSTSIRARRPRTPRRCSAPSCCRPTARTRWRSANGERFVARLVRTSGPGAQRSARWRPDASYLITGGLGGLGLQVARWMVEQGARRIVLLGRSGLPPRADWSAVDPASRTGRRIAAVRELEALGASVHLGAVDVADEPALREFLETFRREGWPPIRGVVHAAGTVHYGPLVQTTAGPARRRAAIQGGRRLAPAPPARRRGARLLRALLVGLRRAELAARRRLRGRQRLPRRARPPASERGPSRRSASTGGCGRARGWPSRSDAEGLAALTARGMGSLRPRAGARGPRRVSRLVRGAGRRASR